LSEPSRLIFEDRQRIRAECKALVGNADEMTDFECCEVERDLPELSEVSGSGGATTVLEDVPSSFALASLYQNLLKGQSATRRKTPEAPVTVRILWLCTRFSGQL